MTVHFSDMKSTSHAYDPPAEIQPSVFISNLILLWKFPAVTKAGNQKTKADYIILTLFSPISKGKAIRVTGPERP